MTMNLTVMASTRLTTAWKFVRLFASDTAATTSIEYCLIAAMISVACIGAFTKLGGADGGLWGNTASQVANAMK